MFDLIYTLVYIYFRRIIMQTKSKPSIFADLSLVLVALIWGAGFICTRIAIDLGIGSSIIMATRFPVAALMDTRLWILKLTHIKMTDNRLGFGKKIIWTHGTRHNDT